MRAGLPVRPTLEPHISIQCHTRPTYLALPPRAGRAIGASAVAPGSSGTGAAHPTPAAWCAALTSRSACRRSCPKMSCACLVRRSTQTLCRTPHAPRDRGRSAAASTTRGALAARRGTLAPTAPRASRNARAHTHPTINEGTRCAVEFGCDGAAPTVCMVDLHRGLRAALCSVCPAFRPIADFYCLS